MANITDRSNRQWYYTWITTALWHTLHLTEALNTYHSLPITGIYALNSQYWTCDNAQLTATDWQRLVPNNYGHGLNFTPTEAPSNQPDNRKSTGTGSKQHYSASLSQVKANKTANKLDGHDTVASYQQQCLSHATPDALWSCAALAPLPPVCIPYVNGCLTAARPCTSHDWLTAISLSEPVVRRNLQPIKQHNDSAHKIVTYD